MVGDQRLAALQGGDTCDYCITCLCPQHLPGVMEGRHCAGFISQVGN